MHEIVYAWKNETQKILIDLAIQIDSRIYRMFCSKKQIWKKTRNNFRIRTSPDI